MVQIDISSAKIVGTCDLKCAYNFNYLPSNSYAINSSDSIVIIYDNKDTGQVSYNKEKYGVNAIVLVHPSLHLYNGKLADGEIIISQTPEKGGKPLIVFIPLIVSDQITSASITIKEIINNVASTAPKQGDKVTTGLIDLQKIVPKKPFMNYTDKNNNNIVFGLLDAIPISKITMDKFKSVVKPYIWKAEAENANGLFYNSSGPNSTTDLGDGIYISCNPTGSSEETTEVTFEKPEIEPLDFENIFEDPTFMAIFQIFIACLIFLIIFYIFNYGYKIIDGEFGMSKAPTSAKS